jgi:hypothetical protein
MKKLAEIGAALIGGATVATYPRSCGSRFLTGARRLARGSVECVYRLWLTGFRPRRAPATAQPAHHP